MESINIVKADAIEPIKSGGPKVNVSCCLCGKITAIHPCQFKRNCVRRFCSCSCRAKFYSRQITQPCSLCSKPFTVAASRVEKYGCKYCSKTCMWASKRRGKYKKCPVCLNDFWSQEHRAKSDRGTFCSIRCYRVGRNTAPERAVAEWLTERGIKFETQVEFKIGYVDFYLADRCLVIEVDGDYWHSTDKQKCRDKRRDAYLAKTGIRVIRILGSSIKKDLEFAMEDSGIHG